jgi:hypothetical protein
MDWLNSLSPQHVILPLLVTPQVWNPPPLIEPSTRELCGTGSAIVEREMGGGKRKKPASIARQ